ncbi:MAG: HlyD family secretion protein [Rhodospirillaceae bacterium]|jgi:membrane fusion protein (multidrug efflux system)|nr:HlyD family secretion protein [Rhodospirillaceae bacterium]MBT3883686.1 HlyD family secretion protein [Rhodospirillaceae bacterium]MBT4117144.1 HlyD family secretion protein [Rhodospirillaceae bacterium]MBT5180637.1 HlyD family secretion protein [Rhodospirillaceae bacterium]MBT5838868.1 HlyD family secretion protein [Rhodospirillaceae bacterium]
MPLNSLFGSGANRVIRVSLLVAALAAGGVWGTQWLQFRAAHVYENDARISADMIAIASRVDGWVVERAAAQGDHVKAGDILVRIDGRDAKLKLEALQARIAEIKAEQNTVAAEAEMIVSQTRHRTNAQKHRLQASRVAVQAAEKQVLLHRSERRRIRALAHQRIVSQTRLEKTEVDYNDAEEHLRLARAEGNANASLLAEARAAGAEAGVLRSRIQQLRAEERRVQAQLEQQRLDIGDRNITSPISGVVDTTFVDKGEFVRPGQRMMLIHDPDKIYISANIRETDLRDVAVGAAVKISVDAFPGRKLQGVLTKIGDAATSQFALLPNPNPSGNFTKVTQRIPVTIAIGQIDGRLRPGMMVEIDIVIPGREPEPSS